MDNISSDLPVRQQVRHAFIKRVSRAGVLPQVE
jgi:hypothetical protein